MENIPFSLVAIAWVAVGFFVARFVGREQPQEARMTITLFGVGDPETWSARPIHPADPRMPEPEDEEQDPNEFAASICDAADVWLGRVKDHDYIGAEIALRDLRRRIDEVLP